jgi:hypothetical protein
MWFAIQLFLKATMQWHTWTGPFKFLALFFLSKFLAFFYPGPGWPKEILGNVLLREACGVFGFKFKSRRGILECPYRKDPSRFNKQHHHPSTWQVW